MTSCGYAVPETRYVFVVQMDREDDLLAAAIEERLTDVFEEAFSDIGASLEGSIETNFTVDFHREAGE